MSSKFNYQQGPTDTFLSNARKRKKKALSADSVEVQLPEPDMDDPEYLEMLKVIIMMELSAFHGYSLWLLRVLLYFLEDSLIVSHSCQKDDSTAYLIKKNIYIIIKKKK